MFAFTPKRNFHRADTVTGAVSDGQGGTNEATVAIKVLTRPGCIGVALAARPETSPGERRPKDLTDPKQDKGVNKRADDRLGDDRR